MEDEKKVNEPEQETPVVPEEKPETQAAPEETVKPEEEAKPEEAGKEEGDKEMTSEEARKAALEELEKASQKALEAMRESGNEENKEVVDNAEKKIEDIFDDLSAWMKENTQPERVKAEMKAAAAKINEVLNHTREKVEEVAKSEQFKKTMESGKDFVIGTGSMIADGLRYGYDKLLEIPEVKKAADYVGGQVNELRKNQTLKNIVDKSEEGLSSLNKSIFNGLKSFFDEPAPAAKPEEKDELPELPKDDDEVKPGE